MRKCNINDFKNNKYEIIDDKTELYKNRLCPDTSIKEYLQLKNDQFNYQNRENIVIEVVKCNKLVNSKCHSDDKI